MLVLQPKLDEVMVFKTNDVEIRLEFFMDDFQLHVRIDAPVFVNVSREKMKTQVEKQLIRRSHLDGRRKKFENDKT